MMNTDEHGLKTRIYTDKGNYLRRLFCLFLTVLFCLFRSLVWAEPQITNATPTLQHKQSITISGSGFGTKNPAAPLVWDDAETGNAPTEKFTSTRPRSGEGAPEYYTTVSLGRNEPQAHSLSTRYIVGRHWKSGACDWTSGVGSVMLLTGDKDNPITDNFISYYYKLDSDYPDCCGDRCSSGDETTLPNHKTENWDMLYDNVYSDVGTLSIAAYYRGDPTCIYIRPAGYFWYTHNGYSAYESNEWGSPSVPWSQGRWLKRMIAFDPGISASNPGIFEATVLNSQNNYAQATFAEKIYEADNPFHTIAIGGYERWYCDRGDTINSFRYFDDVYIDKTFARVVLTDNADYTKSTIIEPQIPSAWSDSSITVTVNQGKLSNGNAYLFVFDKNNNRNSVGYPITFGTGGLQGDINKDGKVDIKDLILVAKDFGKTSGFNLGCDLNGDARVDIKDLIIVAKNFGRSL